GPGRHRRTRRSSHRKAADAPDIARMSRLRAWGLRIPDMLLRGAAASSRRLDIGAPSRTCRRTARSAAAMRASRLRWRCAERCQMHSPGNLTTMRPSLDTATHSNHHCMQPSVLSHSTSQREELRRWTVAAVESLFALPFNDLLDRAHRTHRGHHDPNAVQLSTLLSIKTGGCPEDCAYCPQAARYHTGVANEAMLTVDDVVAAAAAAKAAGATRFCMGAAWRGPKQRDLAAVAAMVREV